MLMVRISTALGPSDAESDGGETWILGGRSVVALARLDTGDLFPYPSSALTAKK